MTEYIHNFHPDLPIRDMVLPTTLGMFADLIRHEVPVEAVVFGGSYANGKYRIGDDVDFDIRYRDGELGDFVTLAQSLVV